MFFQKHKKIILSLTLICLISSLGIFVFGVGEAKAAWVIDRFIKGILIAFGYVFLGILWLASQIQNVAAGLVSGILSYTLFIKAPIVVTGWGICRDLVNMFFVLILLVIAFATILRIETYGMKRILWKLIVAALLINFSLVLAGPIIDFSQVLTQFFIDASGGENFVTQIAAALNLEKANPILKEKECPVWENCDRGSNKSYDECMRGCDALPDSSICGAMCQSHHCQCKGWQTVQGTGSYDWGEGVKDTINIIMGLSMSILFSAVAIFAFFAFAFFLIVRIIIIWFLLILAPIAWFFWILPATQKLFDKWWETFIKWVFFAPAYMFFIYLALKTFPSFLTSSVLDASDTGVKPDAILPKLFSFEYLFQFILVMGILLGGLIVAQKMSIYGAGGAIKMAKGIGGKVSGVAATQRWWKAKKSVREDKAKERIKARQREARVSGVGQWTREHLRPTAKGRAEAVAEKNKQITDEAKRMGQTMDLNAATKTAGRRLWSPRQILSRSNRTQRLAARALMANPRSVEYRQMMNRTKAAGKVPAKGTRKRNKINRLINRVNQQKTSGKFVRYRW